MMAISPSEARALTYWEYTALLSIWNDRHSDDKEKPVNVPRLRRFVDAHRDG